ncbi:MAG: RelA/SpoT family protein [Deltaproteobacteria bacterium]|nr:RelA/SpoT family protein [Deltaproteobacteria bacterium]
MDKATSYLPPETDLRRIRQAFEYSARLHGDRLHPSGVPRLQYALNVAVQLARMRMDVTSILAGLLHDVFQEELARPAELTEAMGPEVTGLLEELSRISRATYHSSEESRAVHMRQMILATTRDLRVILVLLAERLVLARALSGLPPQDRRSVARELRKIYAPLAHRLGIHSVKAELEDLAFQELEPEDYARLKALVDARLTNQERSMERINRELAGLLEREGLPGEVLGRTKHYYSIKTKMEKTGAGLDQIYDLIATRMILDTKDQCYKALGLIHQHYTPLPGRFKDYVALPKENGYQSLHTTVIGRGGEFFEVQIRTRDMHRQADWGVAAHFLYKAGQEPDEEERANLAWFRQLLANLESGQNHAESMEMVSRDLAAEQIYVFTPTGEVIKLPARATPIDFAYSIHTEVGNRCVGARMDGRMIPIRTPLRNGSVVEIITSAKQEPHKDWLKFAHTSKALAKIRSHLREQEESAARRTGRERLTRELRKAGVRVEEMLEREEFKTWMSRNGLQSPDELFQMAGFGKMDARTLLEKTGLVKGAPRAPRPQASAAAASKGSNGSHGPGVLVAGMGNIVTRLARCCQPVFGDPITGLITRTRGVSVHNQGCPNLLRESPHPDRLIPVQWAGDTPGAKPVRLELKTDSSQKALAQAAGWLEEAGYEVQPGVILPVAGGYAQNVTVMVDPSRDVETILHRLNAMAGVRAALSAVD